MKTWLQRMLITFTLLVTCVGALPVAARAQDDSAHQRERAAKEAFDAGVAAAEAGDYARARVLFLRSRQLVVKASTLLNLAVADLKLGLVDEALFALDALDAPANGPGHERMRERARVLRSEAESLRRAAEEARAAEAAAEPEAELVDAPSPPREATSQPDTDMPETRESAPLAAAEPAAQPVRALHAPRALLIVGGVLAAGALGSALWWADRSEAVDACRPSPGVECLQRSQLTRQEGAAMGLTLALGVSALAALTGGAVWLVQRKQDARTRVGASAWGMPNAAGAGVHGVF